MVASIKTGSYTNAMKQTERLASKYQKQLTTGKKVNSAADDAAALVISNKMLQQIGSYKQTSSNITSQISSNRIAEGAYSGISDTYNDMSANAIRAMNGTMSDSDVAAIKDVNDALQASTSQVAATTRYNEQFVVDDVNSDFDSLDLDAISEQASAIASTRSTLGAEENGLVHEQNVNDIAEENTTAAYSRKVDAEMEKAATAYKTQATMNQVQTQMLRTQLDQQNGITTLFQ